MQNLVLAFFRAIGKTYIFEVNRVAKTLARNRVGSLFHVVFRVEKREDRGRSAHRLLKTVIEERETSHRIVKLEEQDDKRREHAHGHPVFLDLDAADEKHEGNSDCANGVHKRGADGLDADAA